MGAPLPGGNRLPPRAARSIADAVYRLCLSAKGIAGRRGWRAALVVLAKRAGRRIRNPEPAHRSASAVASNLSRRLSTGLPGNGSYSIAQIARTKPAGHLVYDVTGDLRGAASSIYRARRSAGRVSDRGAKHGGPERTDRILGKSGSLANKPFRQPELQPVSRTSS